MLEWIGLGIVLVLLAFFLYKIYGTIYRELLDIQNERGPDIRPILSFATAVNYPKGSKLRAEVDWWVGFTITETRDGIRRVEFTGTGAEEYFTGKSQVYAQYAIPILRNGSLKSLPKLPNLVIYDDAR